MEVIWPVARPYGGTHPPIETINGAISDKTRKKLLSAETPEPHNILGRVRGGIG